MLAGERAHYELAAGKDMTPLYPGDRAVQLVGGMLPEQVWDHDDLPAEGMYKGQSAGSAKPLVWAHAEYIKLLRSAVEGRCLTAFRWWRSGMREAGRGRSGARLRYSGRARPVMRCGRGAAADCGNGTVPGAVCDGRVEDAGDAGIAPVGYPGSYADLPTVAGAAGKIEFTMYWPAQEWLGRNFEVGVVEDRD